MIAGAFDAIAVTSSEVFVPVEKDRRWGMICTCPEHVRLRLEGAKHVECWWNSRRLGEAWDFVKSRIQHYSMRSREVSLDAHVGNRTVWGVTHA